MNGTEARMIGLIGGQKALEKHLGARNFSCSEDPAYSLIEFDYQERKGSPANHVVITKRVEGFTVQTFSVGICLTVRCYSEEALDLHFKRVLADPKEIL